MEENEDSEKRYFLVYFTGINKKNRLRKGKIHMYTNNGCYVNENHIHNTIKKEFELTDPYISRIEELSEEDFLDFISIDEEVTNNNQQEFL